MMCVCTYATTLEFRVNLCASCLCVFIFFENKDTGTFSEHKAVPVQIERTGSCLRIVVTGGKGFSGIETAYTRDSDCGLSTAGNDHIRLIQKNEVVRTMDSV